MKLVKYDVSKKGPKAVLKSAWRNHLKQPIKIRVIVEPADDYQPEITIETADPAHLSGLFAGFATMAWASGWRPKGLVNVIAHALQNYKEPSE